MIEQSAGEYKLTLWDDGAPVWTDIEVDGKRLETRVSAESLHDLRYCIDRVLAKLEARRERRRQP